MGALSTLPYFDAIITVVLGAVLGSFATALAHRSASEESWGKQIGLRARSRCTSCAAPLGLIDLIPILSWLFLRGSCRVCDAKISVTYLLIELAAVAMCLGVLALHGLSVSSVLMMCAVPFLLALFVVDLRHMILPDVLVACFAVLGLISVGLSLNITATLYALGAGAVYGALLWSFGWITAKALRKESLGFGDVKYFAASGIWLGFSALGSYMILSGVIGVIFAVMWKLLKKNEYFPFGPALICATYILFLIN